MADGYGEIFACLPTYSCSIPFLDLPPPSHCSDLQSIDYSEIFGGSGSNGGDFAVDFKELFKPSKKTVGRISMEAKFGQQFEEASLLSEEASKDLGECSMKSNSSSFSNHRDDGSKQFSMSDHRLSHGSVEDVISGKTQVTQLNIVAGYTHVTDSCSSLENVKCDNPINIQTDDLVHSVSSVGLVNNIELGKKTLHASSTDNTKIYEADLNTNQKNFSTKLKHHSRSSSSHSTSSGDLTYPNVTYVCAYDINLRTQPSNVPPPFRAPPKVFSKKETTEMNMYRRSTGDQEVNILKPTLSHQIHYRVGASKSGRFLGVAKDTYSSFFDVNEDANSAAATMKEAMEQAQAKLESAKELMERERDNLQGRKKLGQKEATKYNEMEIKASEKGNIFHDEITKKPLLKEGKRMKKHALHDTKNVMTTEKKERDVGTTEESQQMKQGYGFKSFQMPYKSEEVSAEWKTEKEFYELVNNEKKFRVVKEAFTHKDAEKKPKTTAEFDVDKHEINEVVAIGDNNSIAGNINNSIAGNMTWMEDISEIPNSVLETCSLKENVNKLEEVHSCNHQKESEKVQAEQEALFNEQKLKKQNLSETVSLCGVSEKNGEFFTDAFKLEEIYHNDEENGNSQVAEEACTHAVEVKKLSGTNLTSLYESEKKLNINMQDNCQSRNEEIECKLDGTSSVSVQKESKKLDGACMQVDIDLESKLVQDGNEVIENSEIRKQMKPIKETQPDYNEMLEAPLELLQNKNKVNANQILYQQENTLKTRVMGGNHVESEDIQSEEVHEALCTSQNFISDVHKTEKMESEWTIERETEHEKETTRKSEEEREREREREKDRGVVERAAREAHERAVFEARERVERIAVEKALKEVKLKAERAAVERALAEARERAVKKALDEIAAADARKHAEKLHAISREKGRKENESRDILRAFDVEDTKMKLKAGSSDALHDERFLNVGSSSNSQRHADSYAHGEVESPLRCKARLERHQRTIERAAKALAEKNMRDDLAQREQAERNRLAESLDADVRRWSTGKEGNLRALLSTLQYILGPESGWQPIPLTDVITAAAAKKAYKKATLCVHPDKLQQRGANIQQKYICEKVFDLLKDAWNEFNSKER